MRSSCGNFLNVLYARKTAEKKRKKLSNLEAWLCVLKCNLMLFLCTIHKKKKGIVRLKQWGLSEVTLPKLLFISTGIKEKSINYCKMSDNNPALLLQKQLCVVLIPYSKFSVCVCVCVCVLELLYTHYLDPILLQE